MSSCRYSAHALRVASGPVAGPDELLVCDTRRDVEDGPERLLAVEVDMYLSGPEDCESSPGSPSAHLPPLEQAADHHAPLPNALGSEVAAPLCRPTTLQWRTML